MKKSEFPHVSSHRLVLLPLINFQARQTPTGIPKNQLIKNQMEI